MDNKILPNEKLISNNYVKKKIFSSTLSKFNFPNDTSKYFNNLKSSNILNEKGKIFKKSNSSLVYKNNNVNKNNNIWEEKIDNIININKVNIKNHLLKKKILRKNISYTTKSTQKEIYEKELLNCLKYFPDTKNDFSKVTKRINFLLNKNKTLIVNQKKYHFNNFNNFNSHKNNNNSYKKIFIKNDIRSRNGMYGKKENTPLIYEFSLTYRNDYSSKSEKNRHEFILNEFNKLKFYLEKNPKNKLLIIKDFLKKFHIKNISEYSDEKLLCICEIICQNKDNKLINLIKPDSNLKKMVYNLLDNIFKLNLNEDNKNNLDLNLCNYTYSPNIREYNNKLSKNKTYYNFRVNKRKRFFSVFDTNSKLKYIERQKEIDKPDKNYSKNFDLLLNEITKEVREIEQKYKKDLENENLKNNYLFITQVKHKSLSTKRMNIRNLSLSPIKVNKKLNINKRNYFIFKKSFTNNKDNKSEKRLLNFCLKKKSKNEKKSNQIDNNKEVKNRLETKDIIKRLYYDQTQKKFGLDFVKRNLKLTEYVTLNFAKKRLYLKRIDNILNPNKGSRDNILYN